MTDIKEMTISELFKYPTSKTIIKDLIKQLEYIASSPNHISEAVADAKHDLEILHRLEEGERARGKYNELIMAVCRKFQGETRHETALKYIRLAENIVLGGVDQSKEVKG